MTNMKNFKVLKNYNYFPKDFLEFIEVLKIKSKNKEKDLNDINTSELDSMGGFYHFDFFIENNFFVDEFNVSKVKYFQDCFHSCFAFNSDLSQWDVSNGIKFEQFFASCENFNQSVLNFDFSNAKEIYGFFSRCDRFNQPLYTFKFNKKLKNFSGFFFACKKFNQDLSMWDVSNIENFDNMFYECKNFKQDLSNWDVSSAQTWDLIFMGSPMENYPELMPEKFRSRYLK